jgi:hypothetical protein
LRTATNPAGAGAAAGIALSHLPGLPLVAAIGIGIGAMMAGMLQLPLTAVLLTTLFPGTDWICHLSLQNHRAVDCPS